MKLFLVALLGVYILSNLYLTISGMILKIKKKKTENEELKKKLEEPKKTTRKKKETEE